MASALDEPCTISLEEFREAAEHSKSVIIETPMLSARWLSESIGVPVFLKCECMQRGGSFKIRGAYNFISRLSEQQRAAGVCAASAGNHAQGVALSAQQLGIRATIFMPELAPLPKVRATEGYGAEVRLAGKNVGECLVLARQFSSATGEGNNNRTPDNNTINSLCSYFLSQAPCLCIRLTTGKLSLAKAHSPLTS
jgi:threonine dehydratase